MRRTEHVMELMFPGLLFPECSSRVVETRDPGALKVPPDAFAFQLHDIEVIGATRDDGKRIETRGEPTNYSGRYYPRARICTLADVEAMGEPFATLADNMRGNGWLRVVQTHRGNWQPLEDGDVVLADLEGNAL
jgi:hypothetical protein